MKNMKLKIAIGSALFVALWTAQTALAWYDPSTGRWLTRDAIGEPGFQAIQRVSAAAIPAGNSVPSASSRWVHRDTVGNAANNGLRNMTRTPAADAPNLYCFVENEPLNRVDALGLASIPEDAEGCYGAHPLYPDDPACDKYGERKYKGVKLSCFCKCPLLRDPWSLYVRGCLSCMDQKGVPLDDAHEACYASADKNYTRPTLALANCYCSCRK